MDYVINVTEHAFERLRERSGINKKAANKLAERAYKDGIKHSETKGTLYRYLSSVEYKSKKGNKLRIYGDKLFVFNISDCKNKKILNENGKHIIYLVTVLQLPNNLVKRVNDIKSKKGQLDNE